MSLRPVVFSGPSGSGKSTLLNMLFKEFPNAFGFSVSHTTRKPRVGEENGKHYHFITKEKMEAEIKAGMFIEHAEFSGNLYGTSKMAVNDVLTNKRICILDIDEQGVKSIKNTDINPLYIFIAPPSLEVLRKRLLSRGTETKESIERRMATADSAVKYSCLPGIYDIIITNDVLEDAFKELREFLLKHYTIALEASTRHHIQDDGSLKPLITNGRLATLQTTSLNDDCSITNISLSPVKLKTSIAEDSPAVVAVDIVSTNDSAVVTTESQNNLIITDRSSAIVNMDGDATENNVVCGKNSWCIIL